MPSSSSHAPWATMSPLPYPPPPRTATSAASSSSPLRSPITPPLPPGRRVSSTHALRDHYQNAASPPTTPSPRARRRPQQHKGKQTVLEAAHSDTRAERVSVDDADDENSTPGRPKHSHELSWSSTTRDSLVDNLLFSLDNLSRGNIGGIEDTPRARDFDWEKWTVPRLPPNLIPPRARSHTYSSSLSSTHDRTIMPDVASTDSGSTLGRRSISDMHLHHSAGSRGPPSSRTNGTLTGVSEKQRAIARGFDRDDDMTAMPAMEESGSDRESSMAHRNSRPQWKRRSVSLNQLYVDAGMASPSVLDRGRPVPSLFSKYESPDHAAPEPSVANGPRTLSNPDASGPVYVNLAPRQSALRKITTQSDMRSVSHSVLTPSIPTDVRHQANNFVRASSIRGSPVLPPMPGSSREPVSPAFGNSKAAPPPSRERPGFFRRVFGGGSAKANPTSPKRIDSVDTERHPSTVPRTSSSAGARAKIESRQSHKDSPTGQSQTAAFNPPVPLNKKPSSFFRRRKKSASENIPPPPLPTNDKLTATIKQLEPSPSISSLRKVMDPYLDGASDPRDEDVSRPVTHGSSATDSDSLDIFHSGYTPPVDASLGFRDPLSRSPTMKPKVSPKVKLKLKKQSMDAAVDNERRISSVHNFLDMTDDHENTEVDTLRGGSIALTGHGEGLGITTSPTTRKLSAADDSERSLLKPSTVTDDVKENGAKLSPLDEDSSAARKSSYFSAANTPTTPNEQYQSATSLLLPDVQVEGEPHRQSSDFNGTPVSQMATDDGAEYRERARKIYEGDETDVNKQEASAWLGENNTLSKKTREAYLNLFDFSNINILGALRILCGKLVLRAETQQFDRIITALSERWCECNSNHGFKGQDVIHTIIYSLILLNTDLHLADISEKMSRSAYVKNTLPTIRRVVADAVPSDPDQTIRPSAPPTRPTLPWTDSNNSVPSTSDSAGGVAQAERTSLDSNRATVMKRLSIRPSFPRTDSDGADGAASDALNALVTQPSTGSMKTWEVEIEAILKAFFNSIKTEPLPLSRPPVADASTSDRNISSSGLGASLKRTGSIISKAPSDGASFRKPGLRAMTMGLQSRYNRSKPKVYPASTLGSSSRTSFDDGGSVWSPAQSSSLSKYSFNRTLNSASMHSLGQHYASSFSDFKHSIGFASALSQAIIREEAAGNREAEDSESLSILVPQGLLEDEALALEGAPWAKEGLVKHKHHLESEGKRAKERSWTDCFAVLSTGKLTLFAFNTSSKAQSIGRKAMSRPSTAGARASSIAAPTVGGGDWMENAEQLDVFILRQTIASTLPSPGYSKTRPHVWALSLPSGAVHLFQVGTPEIAKEFMSTANYWSARLSKEPLAGGVSNIEYGWSEDVINTALLENRPSTTDDSSSLRNPPMPVMKSRSANHIHTSSAASRPSFQSSVRGSFDAGFGSSRHRLPGDKLSIAEWNPPPQSMMPSQLMEVDQLRALAAYVTLQEEELERHNELKHAIEFAYTPRHTNHSRALANWQRKSDYLLREIVKFRTYIDCLTAAQTAKEAFYARRPVPVIPAAMRHGSIGSSIDSRVDSV